MFNKLLNKKELYSMSDNGQSIDTLLTIYEVFIEEGKDKEGNLLRNKDDSIRYFPIDDEQITILDKPIKAKKVADNFYKKLFKLDGQDMYLEKALSKNGNSMFFEVLENDITVLESNTVTREMNNDHFRVITAIGYVLIDETDIENRRILTVKPFTTADHLAEANEVLNNSSYRHRKA